MNTGFKENTVEQNNFTAIHDMMVRVDERIRDAIGDKLTISPCENLDGWGWEGTHKGLTLRWVCLISADDLIPEFSISVGFEEHAESAFVSVAYVNDLQVSNLFWNRLGMDPELLDDESEAILDRLPELKAWEHDPIKPITTHDDEEAFGWIDTMIRAFLRFESPNR
jgi:hypothetical protein